MDLLSDILAVMKMRGTLYFRTAFSAPWGVQVPAFENVARFHFAHRGRCWVRVEGVEDPVLLNQGDLVVIPHGASHVLADPKDVSAATLDNVLETSGFTGEGALVYGHGSDSHATELICGHFAFDNGATHPLIEALPPFIHIHNYGDVAHLWLEQTLKVIGSEVTQSALGADLIALKLSETICVQAIRAYLSTEGRERSVLAGFTDPRISRALQAVHQTPHAPWTLESMAKAAGQSRTAFAERFRRLMGQAPHEYLTEWRMQVARQLLLETDIPVIDVAERVGYQSESSFGRVFKRSFNHTPSSVRRTRPAIGT